MKLVLTLILFGALNCGAANLDKEGGRMAFIHGKVTDFEGKPIADADIDLKNDNFETLYSTKSDSHGNYKLAVKPGRYSSLFACKDYSTKNLEYWAWNVIVDSDLEINPRFQGLEVYGINAFRTQQAPGSMHIYLRPMSLKRTQMAGGKEKLRDLEFIDIAPKLKKPDIKVEINSESVDVLEINRVNEYVSQKQAIAAYLIQTSLPKVHDKQIWYICITLRDSETNEQGEGCLFWEKV